jgi:hypothetical protein
MAEAVRSARGSEGLLITASGETDAPSLKRRVGVGGSPDCSTANSPRTSASSALNVDNIIATLLRIASQRLRVGGRLVFFAPHRDHVKSVRSSLRSAGGPEGGEVQGQGLVVVEEGSGPALERAVVIAATAVSAVPATLAAVDAGPIGSGIEQKMSKRKAFKKKAKTQAPHPDAPQDQLRTAPCLSPLSFLPPLPADLVLVEYHQQVMSPTFSRWLCVMQKVETKTNEELTGGED